MKSIYFLVGAFATVSSAQSSTSSISKGFSEPRFSSSTGGKALCVSGMVPVKATSPMNVHLNLDIPANMSVVTQGFVDMFTSESTYMTKVLGSPHTVSGTYNIYAELCYPTSGINAKTIQFLTHGIGFDNSYWDFAQGYSFVDTAAAAGYTTFAYDRLGIGKSATPDPIQVVQAPLEAEIAHELITMLRGGHFASTSFKNVVGVGHSFGSVITTGVAHSYPTAIDAAVLTGFSVNMTALPVFISALNLQIARTNNHLRFANLNNGYLVSDTITANQFDFFHEPGYPPANLALAELTKGTVTLGELLTMSAVAKPATKFTGPIDVVNGEYDYPFCFGNCHVPTNQAAAVKSSLYPKASKASTTYLAAAAGHGLNLHYSAEAAFTQIQKFVKSNGF